MLLIAAVGVWLYITWKNNEEGIYNLSEFVQVLTIDTSEKFQTINPTLAPKSSKTPALDNHAGDIAFDPEFSPYYAQLTESEKELYALVYDAIERYDEQLTLDYDIDQKSIDRAMLSLFKDQPQFFWIDTKYATQIVKSAIKTKITITFSYNELFNNITYHKQKFDAAVDKIISKAKTYESIEDQELYIHDYIAKNTSYVDNAPYNQTAYSAIVNHQSVCAGHARAFQLLMKKLGVPCYYCTGTAVNEETGAEETHGWNIVKIDDKYYNVDVTWDKIESKDYPQFKNNVVIYKYFNRTDDYFNKYRHTRESDVSDEAMPLPDCRDVASSFDNVFGLPQIVKSFSSEFDISVDDVVQNLNEYFLRCYSTISKSGKSKVDQYMIITGKSTKDDIEHHTNQQRYDGYLKQLFENKYKKYTKYKLDSTTIAIGEDIWFMELHHSFM